MRSFASHWPEYAIEALCLALFMVSAAGFAVLLQHPHSPLAGWLGSPLARRVPMGLAMGLTAAALIYSPFGGRSGAHMNPAVTLAFLRLGKIGRIDAAAYIGAHFIGAAAGMAAAIPLFGDLPADPSVNYVATMPGQAGAAVAFVSEAVMSCALMATVLAVSNSHRFAAWTGWAAAALVAAFIVVEAPLSGMSMNPARTLGSALFAKSSGLWIYFTAPTLGMLAAADVYAWIARGRQLRCAKLHHRFDIPCVFHCESKTGASAP
jgi:aquaporin Z